MTASFLAALGIHLGERLVPANPANLVGYFEDLDFVELQARMLEAATREGDGGHRDWGWTESEYLDRVRYPAFGEVASALAAARTGSAGLWGWKDPRTTLLLDFWDDILGGDALYVLLYRFPWEVADSIQRLGAPVFLANPEYALRIWAFYNRSLLDFYRRHADRAILVSANALQRDPGIFVELLRSKLQLALGDAVLETVWQRDLFVTFDPEDPLIRLTAATSPECTQLLEQLEAAADLPATGLWRVSPLCGQRLRPSGPVDLSVVTPCYNHGQFLVDAVASVERTATERCEFVVVNDGSTQPRTLEVLDILRQAGYRIIDQANAGLAAARNTGIRAARGRFILPLDADNRLARGFLESAIRVLDTEAAVGVVYGDRLDFGIRSGRARVPEFDIGALLWWNFIDACAVYRREIWQACGGYDVEMTLLEDWEFWISAAKCGWQFRRLSDVAFEYRVRPNSMLAVAGHGMMSSTWKHVYRKHRTFYEERLFEVLTAGRTQLMEAWREVANLKALCGDGLKTGNRESIGMEKLSAEKVSKISLEVSPPPPEVPISALFWLDAEVTNQTNEELSSAAPYPVRLAYHWVEKTTRRMAVYNGDRSELFPSIDPNATRRYPMKIVAPNQPGEYILQITIVQDGVFWFEDVEKDIVQEFPVSVLES